MMELGALHFSGNETIMFQKNIRDLADTFTYEFWVTAEAEQTLEFEQISGISGVSGKNYLIGPDFLFPENAGFGIAVGTNGISIHEHTVNDMPAKLVYAHSFAKWQHVAVVYDNKLPRLYINGKFIKQGLPSKYDHVYPSLAVGGHTYGHFIGKAAQVRVWSMARTEAEIQAFMFTDLKGDEPGLYWHWNPASGTLVANSTPKNIQVSVIMPSHNRCPLNYYALRTLQLQTYPADQMEVIFLDDGSTDSTPSIIDHLNPPFPIKYVRLEKPVGRGKVRNIGISIASGAVLLFLDAEMLCPADFIEKHMRHHQSGIPLVVSGSMKVKRIYTVADPCYSEQQISQLQSLYLHRPSAQPLIDHFIQKDRTVIQLLPLESMGDREQLDPLSYEYDYFDGILAKHGPHFKEFHYSWMNFITSNVSLPKSLLDRSGYFDERFEGYGWEDWELGLRLYKKGACFIHDDEVVNYHQEHPRPTSNWNQSRQNFMEFVKLHPGFEVQFMVLDMIPHRKDMVTVNEYLTELFKLRAIYGEKYAGFEQYMLVVLDKLCYLLSIGAAIYMPLPGDIADGKNMRISESRAEADEIRDIGLFPKLMEAFDLLNDFIVKDYS